MPRDAAGNYTLPAGNPVVSGTIIASGWANPTMGDLAQAMTDSLDRNGNGGMLAPFRFLNGAETLPALAFTNDILTGRYLASANDQRDVVAGQDVVRYQVEQVTVTGSLNATDQLQEAGINLSDKYIEIGEFGLGLDNLPAETVPDLDTHATSGFWSYDADEATAPTDEAGAFIHIPRAAAADADLAQAQLAVTESGGLYLRTLTASVWGGWGAVGTPVGGIIIWSGAQVAIPAGWLLCDGTLGTPDLTDKFVVGAGGGFPVGDTGGTDSHTHTVTVSAHTLTVAEMPSHGHRISDVRRTSGFGGGGNEVLGNLGVLISDSVGGGGAHTHSAPATGSANALPPYYSLAYIMKT